MRRFLLLLGAIFILHFCQAQVSLGLKAGINATTLGIGSQNTLSGRKVKSWRSGLHAGALMRAPVSGRLFVQPELLYALKGYVMKATSYSLEYTNSLHYITLPLLAGYALSKKLSLVGGPEFGYLLSASSKYDGGWGPGNQHDFKNFDFGADLGVMYKVNNLLGIDLRFTYGLRDQAEGFLYDQYGQLTGYYKEGKNRSLQVGIHYLVRRK